MEAEKLKKQRDSDKASRAKEQASFDE